MDYECARCVKSRQSSESAAIKRRIRINKRYELDVEFKARKQASEATRYAADPAKVGQRVRESKRLLKKEVLARYSGGTPRCGVCMEGNLAFLCLDHVEDNGAEHRRADSGVKNPYLWARKHGFPPLFQVLCHNCNAKKFLALVKSDSSSSKRWWHKLKTDVLSHYSDELKCAQCDVRDMDLLTLDHIDGGGCAHVRQAGGSRRMYSDIRRKGYPPGYQVLCWNHNLGKHCLGD